MINLNDKVTIIIRSIGERTEQLCRELILAQGIALGNVVIVSEAPFSTAMRKSFEIGIEYGRPWTFCVDADVLLRPEVVQKLIEFAEKQEENIFEVQGFILDKFFGGPREAGNHLYRTSLLDKVIAVIPAEGVNIRPEAHTIQTMVANGYKYVAIPLLIGVHDFEQYYRDIFRKCFVHSHKFSQYAGLLLTTWRKRASNDMDYHVALQGFAQGVSYYGQTLIDTRQQIYRDGFIKLQIEEKTPLLPDSISVAQIEQIIAGWIEPEIYQQQFPTKMGLIQAKHLSSKERFYRHLSTLGPARIVPYIFGWFLKEMGEYLQNLVTDR